MADPDQRKNIIKREEGSEEEGSKKEELMK